MNKVIIPEINPIYFSELPRGGIFKSGNEVYMVIYNKDYINTNAVNLITGVTTYFPPRSTVTPVASATIKPD